MIVVRELVIAGLVSFVFLAVMIWFDLVAQTIRTERRRRG